MEVFGFVGRNVVMKEKIQEESTIKSTKSPQSFVEMVNNVCDIPVSRIPKSYVKEERLSIVIPKEEYLLGVEA